MSQKEETIQKLSQLRTNLTSEENSGTLREKIDIDTDTPSYDNRIGELAGRQLGEILGRRVGERLGHAFDERFGGETTLSSITDPVSNALETVSESDTEESDTEESDTEESDTEESASDESSESADDDSDDEEFEADLSELSTGKLQSLANQLMDELQQRSETE